MSGGMDNGHDGPYGHSMRELNLIGKGKKVAMTDAPRDEPELCPFDCDNHGGRPVIEFAPGGFQVSCNACNARGPVEYSEAQAIKSWNRRHRAPSALPDEPSDDMATAGARILGATMRADNQSARAIQVWREMVKTFRTGALPQPPQ